MERAPSKRALSLCDGHHDVGFLVLAVSRFTAWAISPRIQPTFVHSARLANEGRGKSTTSLASPTSLQTLIIHCSSS
jgi:hypothetical protein